MVLKAAVFLCIFAFIQARNELIKPTKVLELFQTKAPTLKQKYAPTLYKDAASKVSFLQKNF